MVKKENLVQNFLKFYYKYAALVFVILHPQQSSASGGGDSQGAGSDDFNAGVSIGVAAAQNANAAFSSGLSSYTGSFASTMSDGTTVSGNVSISASGDISVSIDPTGSTPFLLTHNGERFVHENDFLFGKPNTAFANHRIGLAAYARGIGGDTYLIQNELKADKDGNLKLQIRELEPEESFIDKFELNALDLKENEHFVADGNLEDGYVFDTKEAKTVEGQNMNQFHKKNGRFGEAESAYMTLKQDGPNVDLNAAHDAARVDSSLTLESNDELIIQIPRAGLKADIDTFILVDSYYRDWSLGGSVPFSALERFQIGSIALGRSAVVTLSGVVLLAAAVLTGNQVGNLSILEKIVSIPYTYADEPHHCQIDIGGVGTQGGNNCGPGGPGNGERSLLISAGDSTFQTYLQTLFPRYVQASQEVVRIPKEIIAKAKEEFLSVRIKATKKHKVRSAFVFQGTPKTPTLRPLQILKAEHMQNKTEHANELAAKNNSFLHTIPGDVVDLTIKDAPTVVGTSRHYVLRANGFYTRMSLKTHWKIGKNWLARLLPEDRKLLRNLRLG